MDINEKEFIWEMCILDFIRSLTYLGYDLEKHEKDKDGTATYTLHKEGGFTFIICTDGNVEVLKDNDLVATFALPQAGGMVKSKIKVKGLTLRDREGIMSYDEIPTHKVKITLEIPV